MSDKLREALEQIIRYCDGSTDPAIKKVAAAALAHPQSDAEPVAWRAPLPRGDYTYCTTKPPYCFEFEPLYTAPPSSRMREALEKIETFVRNEFEKYDQLIADGKGTHGQPGYVRDNTWSLWTGKRNVCEGILAAIKQEIAALRAGDNHDGADQTYHVEYDGFVGTKQGSYLTREGKRGVVLQQVGTKVVHVYNEARIVPVDYASDGKESEGGDKVDSSSVLISEEEQRRHTNGMTPVGTIAEKVDGTEANPSDPTPLDRDAIAWGLAEKWPGDFMQGDDEIEREPSAFAYEVADVAILALLRGGE